MVSLAPSRLCAFPDARRRMQDEDALSTYKIQSSHTIHMVKGAARNNGASSSQGGPPPQALPQMQAGQNVHDPLTQLNGHMGFGLMGNLNPFAELGLNTNDPNLVSTSCSGCVRWETRVGRVKPGAWGISWANLHTTVTPK